MANQTGSSSNGSPKVAYLTGDHPGSPRINTDAAGNVISRHDYQPFGEEIERAGYAMDDVRKQFTGYERDRETDLDFAQARMYSKNHGRFTTIDPIMSSGRPINPKSWNRYTYVLNNPLRFIDPDGLQDCEVNKPCKEIPPPPKINIYFVDVKTKKEIPTSPATQKIIDNLVKKNWSLIFNTAANTEARGNVPDSETTEKSSEKSKSDTLKGEISKDLGAGGESTNQSTEGEKKATVQSLEDKIKDNKSYIVNNAIAISAFERQGTVNAAETVEIINKQLRQEALRLTEAGNKVRLPDEQFKKEQMQQYQNRPPRFGTFPHKYEE